MDTEELMNDFLRAYGQHLEWPERDPEVIARLLCEEYHYGKDNRHFLMTAYGWVWGKTGDEVIGNCVSGLLMIYMNEMYAQVAKENGWED